MQRLGSLFLEDFFMEEEQVFSLMFAKTTHFSVHGLHSEHIWYLDIICIDDLVSLFLVLYSMETILSLVPLFLHLRRSDCILPNLGSCIY
jgi:hypothetical protein